MKITSIFIAATVFVVSSASVNAHTEREAKQAQLNQVCEEARAEKIIPLRKKNIEDCAKENDLEQCQAQFANYGERVGNRVPLFYNLPECVAADEYLRSERSAN